MSSRIKPKIEASGPTLGIGLGVVLLFFWVVTGTVGFRFIEGWSYIDSLYMTIITISTVGFREVHELSEMGRLVASFVIVAGLGTAVYTFTRLGQVLLADIPGETPSSSLTDAIMVMPTPFWYRQDRGSPH